MQIKMSGKPDKTTVGICRKALHYYGVRLLSDRLYEGISITLVFDDEVPTRHKGDVSKLGRLEYRIRVRPDLGNRTMLLTLAHEMVHVCQWARGQMKDMSKQRCKFKGRVYIDHDDYYFYWSTPWEIEAYGREIGLYKTFWLDHNEKKRARKSRR